MATIWRILTRKKVIDPVTAEESNLARVLNTFDLTALGVGSTLGVGVYVLAGHVAKDTAGPAVVLSFFIAAVASVFAGLCYAEFGARVPRAGSAYVYSYVCVGEFVAFIIGWNLILEYVIGSASVARGLSSYLDSLIDNKMQKAFIDIFPINVPYMSEYFDFFTFVVSLVLAVALAFGLKESSLANNIFTILNIGVVLFVIIAGGIEAKPSNWSLPGNSTDPALGDGGFFPFGIEGMIKGAATCFYGFVGFDCIATTGEEVRNPKRAIPISIILSLFIIFLAYFGTSTVITLMVPYYKQNSNAPIPFAFEEVEWYWAKWIVSIGGIFGLCASLFGAMFPLPRIIYAMANDSLLFKFLGKVHPRFQTPVIGTLLAGLMTGLMGALFELKQLVNMMSIGTLLAYTIVAASVLLLRYKDDRPRRYLPLQTSSDSDDSETYTDNKISIGGEGEPSNEDSNLLSYESSSQSVIGQIFNCGRISNPTPVSETIVAIEVFLYCVTCIFIGICAIYLKDMIIDGEIWAIVLTSIVVFIAVILVMSMVTQPTSKKELSFKVPMVPLIPALSILINTYLMLMLDVQTWIRFAVWMIVGFAIYFFSVRRFVEAENRTISVKSTDTQKISNGKTNGIVNQYLNLGFEDDKGSNNNINGTRRIHDVPKSPLIDEKDEHFLLEKELQKLDMMLDEEVKRLSEDSVNRKLSVDTVSVASNRFVAHEENVVAVVHRDNVVTPAESNSPSLFHHNSHNTIDDNNNNIIEKDNEKLVLSSNKVVNAIPSQDVIETITDTDEEIEKTEDESVAFGMVLSEDDISSLDDANEDLDTKAVPMSSTKTPPPSPDQRYCSDDNISLISPPPPPPPPLEDIAPSPMLVRPTSENLSSVKLRKTKPKVDIDPPPTDFQPSDENLRVSSEESRVFKENLNNKLNRMTVVPSYVPAIVYQHKLDITQPIEKEKVPNENVIEEQINPKEAKKKLGAFIDKLLENLETEDNKKDVETNKATENLSVSANDNDIESNVDDTNDTVEKNKVEHDIDIDSEDHKRRMQTVFRSMNLKQYESKKEIQPIRNIKTLGPLNDDKTQHRQAMTNIFKSIELRRKDSTRQTN